MDFKLKPFLGGSMNVVTGAIHLGREPLVKIDGTWDSDIYIYENVNFYAFILYVF